MSRLYLSNPCAFPFATSAHGSLRVPPAPGFPCALCQRGTTNWQSSGENRAVRTRACGRGFGRRIRFSSCRRQRGAAAARSGPERSSLLTIFWHCGHWPFSSRTAGHRRLGNEPSTVLAEDSLSSGFGNADSRRKLRDFGWGGLGRPRARDSGCVPAHPASWRASASYRPLRAVWAVCAWALRGFA